MIGVLILYTLLKSHQTLFILSISNRTENTKMNEYKNVPIVAYVYQNSFYECEIPNTYSTRTYLMYLRIVELEMKKKNKFCT